MIDEQLLALIRGTPWIEDLLVWFDFDVTRAADGPIEPLTLSNGQPLETIAADGAGGAFLLVGDGEARPVVYVSSEGQGGLIATNLRDALALIVGLSSIQDATAIPLSADGGERLLTWLAEADEEIREDWPNLDEDRERLCEALDLPLAVDLLESLHNAAADDRYRPISCDGERYDSMLR